jgi:alpha-mannosidase
MPTKETGPFVSRALPPRDAGSAVTAAGTGAVRPDPCGGGAGAFPRRLNWVVGAAILIAALAAISPAGAEEGFIREWLLLGAFSRDDAATRLSAPILPDEPSVAPLPNDPLEGRTWKNHRSPADTVDLLANAIGFPCRHNAVAFAFCYVASPAEQNAVLRLGSDDGIAAWLNGNRVWFNDASRLMVKDQDEAPVRLLQGWNLLLLKISQGIGPWAFSARFTDADGQPLPGLQCVPHPQAAKSPLSAPPHSIRLLGCEFAPPFVRPDGQVNYPLIVRLRNLSPAPVAGASVTLCGRPAGARPDNPARESGAFAGWERKSIDYVLGLDDLIALNAGSPAVAIRVGDKSLDEPLDGDLRRRLLLILLDPIRIRSWRVQKEDHSGAAQASYPDDKLTSADPGADVRPAGPALWLRARLAVPSRIEGAPLALELGRAGSRMDVYLNGDLQKESKESKEGLWAFPPGAREYVVALRVEPEGNKAVCLPSASIRWADGSARLCADNVDRYETVFPDAPKKVLQHGKEALDAFDRKGASGFLAALKPLETDIRERGRQLKDFTVWYVGQSHIELGWLWRWEEAGRTLQDVFGRAVQFMGEHPRFTFAQSQSAAYAMVEQRSPELFAKIGAWVKEKRWIPVGGMWVEPDLNLPSGESLVRQILHGKRYIQQKFGVDVNVGWNPDAFGHNAQLPQLLKKSGIGYYYLVRGGGGRRLFWWEGLDGSRVLCHAIGPKSPSADIIRELPEAERHAKILMQLFGAEGHAGGIAREDLDRIDRLRESAIAPTVDFGAPAPYFARVERTARDVPVVAGEIQVPFAGCYTTRGEIKQANRRCESLLATAEAAAAVAHEFGLPYDRDALNQAWRLLLFHQSHHVLSGTGIRDLYVDAAASHAEVVRIGDHVLHAALMALAARVKAEGDGIPVLVFNPHAWARTDAAEVEVLYDGHLTTLGVFDETNAEVPSQVVARSPGSVRIAFLARDVPPTGYRVYWVRDAGPKKNSFPPVAVAADGSKVETDRWLLELDPGSGCIRRLFDKAHSREVLAPPAPAAPARNGGANSFPGNLFQLLGDRGSESSRVITYTGERWDLDRDAKVKVVEYGPVRAVLRIHRHFRDERAEYSFGQQSTFQQDLILYRGIDRIDLVHEIDWYERFKILKLAFAVGVRSGEVTAGISYGAVTRPATGGDFPALGWFDLSDGPYGVGILSDGRAGYDAGESLLRVHLLRSSFDVDPEPDKGRHRFTVSLCPHPGDWRQAGVPRRALELNQPLVTRPIRAHAGILPPSASFLAVEPDNVLVGAFKRSEESDALVIRLAEAHGVKGTAARVRLWGVGSPRKVVAKAIEADLIEREGAAIKPQDGILNIPLGPFEIKTIKVVLK